VKRLLVRALPPARYTEDQWRVMRALFDVLKLAAAHLKLVFRERGEVDLLWRMIYYLGSGDPG
jgi:hypothetical protein